MNTTVRSNWPKRVRELTPEQRDISDDWMRYFHEVNRGKFSAVVNFNHRYVSDHSPKNFVSTLDVGAGLGEHISYEKLSAEQLAAYIAIEFRESMADEIRKKWPTVQVYDFDCQRRTPFADYSLDRIVAIHVLEHLPNLPAFLEEARRLLARPLGRLMVVIPCEGGLGYKLGRQFTSKRMFEKRYHQPYGPFIAVEHVSRASEIIAELDQRFSCEHISYYPLRVPSIHLNLCIGLTLCPR